MLSQDEHLEDLISHKERVKNNTIILAKRLIKKNKKKTKLARELILRGYTHDNSKLVDEVEWAGLHCGSDTPPVLMENGMKHHQFINKHHPEFHGGIIFMTELDVYEMVADWLARSNEFASDLRFWIQDTAISKYSIDIEGKQYKWIQQAVELLLQDNFVR